MIKWRKYIDLKLLKLLGIAYALISLISFCKNCYLKLNGYRFQNWNWDKLIVNAHIYDWFYVMVFMSIIAVTTKIMIEKKIKWSYIMSIHFFLSFFIGIFVFILSTLTGIILGTVKLDSTSFDFNLTRYFSVLDLNFLVYFSLVSIIYSYYYFNEKKKSELQNLYLENQLNNVKLKSLKSQLQPHFLFNTLNSIHSLIDADKTKSKEMIVDVSELLREMIDLKDETLVTLYEELHLLNKYLRIMKIRFSDDLKIKIKLENNLENSLVPSLLLQPIVENSIKHGYSKNNIKLNLDITIFKKKNYVIFRIENNGEFISDNLNKLTTKGTGLQNTINRLKTLYDNKYRFKLFNSKNGVTTEVKIPYQRAEFELVNQS